MHVISIDIGLYHLGFIQAYVENKKTVVTQCELIDIKSLSEYCNDSNCELHHERCISDYVSHLFKTHYTSFEKANRILVEQQPPTGFISIQELIRNKYRNKVSVINPRKMHTFFDIGHLNYEQRKEFTVSYATRALKHFQSFQELERKHDMADAYCLLRYYALAIDQRVISKYFKVIQGKTLIDVP